MLGAIFTGLSGLKAYSSGLETISNNVANLNSSGFKSTSVRFADLSHHDGMGSSDTARGGGGVQIMNPRLDFSQGELRVTGNDLDLAIDGNGFLVLRDGDKTYLTRTGQFLVNDDGVIAQVGTDRRLSGLDSDGRLVDLNVDAKKTNAPIATTKISFADNLSSTATTASVTDIPVYDSSGRKHVWTVKFTPVASTPGSWDVAVTDASGASIGTGVLKFIGSDVDPTTAHITVTSTPSGADPLSIDLDFSTGVTSFSTGTTSSIHTSSTDGTALGTLRSVTVDGDGKVNLTFSNGKTEALGAIALMDVSDPAQLEQVGSGLFSLRDGVAAQVKTSGAAGAGKVMSKQLEASNVNLSDQFGELILIQRGFQACSQVVSITNDMIQQLFGIRGQG